MDKKRLKQWCITPSYTPHSKNRRKYPIKPVTTIMKESRLERKQKMLLVKSPITSNDNVESHIKSVEYNRKEQSVL